MRMVMDGKRDAKRTVGDKLDVEDEGKGRTEETANSRVLPSLLFQKHINLLCHCHYSLASLKGELGKRRKLPCQWSDSSMYQMVPSN